MCGLLTGSWLFSFYCLALFQELWKNLHLGTIIANAVKHTEQQEHACAIHLGGTIR